MRTRILLIVGETLAVVALSGCRAEPAQATPARAAPAPSVTMPIPPVAKLAVVPAPDDVAKPPADAETTASGVRSRVLVQGTGTDHPGPNDLFDVRYVVWTSTGEMVDQSPRHPMLLGVHQLFPGFAEGVELMVQGEKRRIWVPGHLAFGDHPKTGLPAGDVVVDATLVKLKKRGELAASK